MTKRTSHLAGLWIGAAISNTSRLTQTKPVLPLSNKHGSQVKDQGRRQCCRNKHKKNFPIGLHVMNIYFPDTPHNTLLTLRSLYNSTWYCVPSRRTLKRYMSISMAPRISAYYLRYTLDGIFKINRTSRKTLITIIFRSASHIRCSWYNIWGISHSYCGQRASESHHLYYVKCFSVFL